MGADGPDGVGRSSGCEDDQSCGPNLHCASMEIGQPVVIPPVPAWRSGNALDSINVLTLRWARLVPGWVTVFGRVNQSGTEPGTQVDSA